MEPDIGWDRNFCLPHLHSTPPLGGRCRNISMMFGVEKIDRSPWWRRPHCTHLTFYIASTSSSMATSHFKTVIHQWNSIHESDWFCTFAGECLTLSAVKVCIDWVYNFNLYTHTALPCINGVQHALNGSALYTWENITIMPPLKGALHNGDVHLFVCSLFHLSPRLHSRHLGRTAVATKNITCFHTPLMKFVCRWGVLVVSIIVNTYLNKCKSYVVHKVRNYYFKMFDESTKWNAVSNTL